MVVLLSVGGAAAQESSCYQLEFDAGTNQRPDWTITVRDDWTLLWSRDDEDTVLETGSAGSGIPTRTAVGSDGVLHTYRMVGDVLVFDMAVYEPGCE